MNNLQRVFEALADSAAKKYRAENLASAEAVQRYADVALGIPLHVDDAAAVRDTAISCLSAIEEGSDERGGIYREALAGLAYDNEG